MTRPFVQLFVLPREIVESAVISKLSWKDLSRFDEAVNNKSLRIQLSEWFKNTTQGYRLLSSTTDSFLSWINSRQIRLSSVRLGDTADEAAVQSFARHNLQVETYTVGYGKNDTISSEATVNLLTSLRGLRHLCICKFEAFGDASMWRTLFLNLPHLLTLVLDATNIRDADRLIISIANCCIQIIHISLSSCEAVRDDSVVLLAERCRQLERLGLTGCDTLTDLSLQALGQHCNKLKAIQLSAQDGAVTDAGLVKLVQGCSHLCNIDLWDCSGVTAKAFAAMSPICARFVELKLDRCTAFRDKAVQLLMNRLCNLLRLDIYDSVGITEQFLVWIIQNNSQLAIIHLHGLECVTDAVVAAMAGCAKLWTLDIRNCTNVTDISALGVCSQLDYLNLRGCSGVLDATLLQLARTPGPQIEVCVRDTSVSAVAQASLNNSTRVRIEQARY